MKQSKDPFEVAFEEQEAESPPDSPIAPGEGMETQTQPHSHVQSESTAAAELALNSNEDEDDDDAIGNTNFHPTSMKPPKSRAAAVPNRGKSKEEEEEEEEEEEDENMEDELAKIPSSGDPDKMAKMQSILSQLTEEQMSRYESFRRSGFQKPNMKRLLASITGSAKISLPMTIVVSGIAKMFVGELVETARIEMARRKESGPIRPSHIREAYRKLKLEGKVPKRSVPRLFR